MKKLLIAVLAVVFIVSSCATGKGAAVPESASDAGSVSPVPASAADEKEAPVNTLVQLTLADNPGKVIVALSGEGNTRRFTFDNPDSSTVTFNTAFLGFMPDDIKVFSWGGISDVLFEVEITPVFSEACPPVNPLPADLREIIFSGTDGWRYSDFEIYTWESFPSILVFDILNYDIQSTMFKRLSYFVEKKGFTGEIHSFADLTGKGDWNAHNYLSRDLASFFTLAESKGILLTSGERNLREILLTNGIISKGRNGRYTGNGYSGIITVSQESRTYLRSLLLNHEGYHGLFYAVPGLKELVYREWEKLVPEAREIWIDYLRTSVNWNYDYENQYLLKNELLGYLMQQQDFSRYFDGMMLPRILKQCPEKADYYVSKQDSIRESLVTMAGVIDEFLGTGYNLEAGNLSYLRELK